MVDPFAEVSFGQGDDELILGSSKLELKKGDEVRVSFGKWKTKEGGDWDFEKGPQFFSAKVNYIKGAGLIINQGPEFTKIAGKEGEQKIGTVVIVWPTDRSGAIDPQMILAGKYDIFPWIFRPNKYQDLMRKNNNMPFCDHDIKITCKDTKYQEFDFDSCKDSILKALKDKNPDVYKEIVKRCKIVEGKLKAMMGTVMTIKELMDKMSEKGGAVVGTSDVVSADAAKLFDDSIGG